MPYASKIELRGFKSFRDKTEIPLSRGLTVIGGPNGSGKSNIVDALCFVLGWMSAKTMRAERFSDLIFKGGDGRRSPRFAEVSLYFNNEDGGIEVDSKTVVITRTVDEEGKSVYRLNRRRVSRQDIVDLLGKSLSLGEYNFILQGDVEHFVRMDSIDRRKIIDELAGIAEYDVKKEKSMSELQKVEANLRSMQVVLEEVRSQLEKLEVERENAIRYRELKDRLGAARRELLRVRFERCASELERVEEMKEELERRIGEEMETHRRLVEEVSSFEEKERRLSDLIEEKQSTETMVSERIRQKLETLIEQLNSLEGVKEELRAEMRRVEGEFKRSSTSVRDLISEFQGACERFVELSSKFLRRKHESLEEVRADLENLRRAVWEMELKVEELKERLEVFEISEKLPADPATLRERLIHLRARLLQLESNGRELRERIWRTKEELRRVSSRESETREAISKMREERERVRGKIASVKRRANSIGERLRTMESKLSELRVEEAKLRTKLEELRESLGETGFKRRGSGESLGEKKLSKLVEEIEDELRELEPVNMRAIEEFRRVEERYLSLRGRYEKLQREREHVLGFIEEIERKKKDAFMRTFEEVSRNFGEIFRELSPGGEARLVLECESNPFEGGVEIEARPGGKEIRRVESMSGGEKSLTALAFILALQKMRSASLYVFDEIDAHLDDEKVPRVARLIKKYSQNSQVIVVTLKDSIMSVADRLFGVTMKDGVSGIVSLELAEYGGD